MLASYRQHVAERQALGIPPLRAATAVLLANTAPVAFGAVAIPITTAGDVGDLSGGRLRARSIS